MQTTYDEKRYALEVKLLSCLEDACELLDHNISGYGQMKPDYAIDLYESIKAAYDAV